MSRLNANDGDFEYEAEDPEGFKAGMKRFGKTLGASATGVSIYELPPGQAICPYHYEYAEEEWLVVLEGTPTLRTPSGSSVLQPWDIAFFPTGPDGAHGAELPRQHGRRGKHFDQFSGRPRLRREPPDYMGDAAR